MILNQTQIKPCLLVLLLLMVQNSFAQNYSCKTNEVKPSEIIEKIPAQMLHKDIDEFVDILEEVHVNPYMKISKNDFYQAIDSVKKSITDPLNRQQFYQVFTPLVDLLNDSHTGVKFPSGIWKYYQYNANGLFFPMEIETTWDKKIHIKRDFSEHKIPKNTEIISINSIKSEDIINTFLAYEHSPIEKSSIKRIESKFVDFIWWILDFRGPYIVETNNGTYNVNGQTWEVYKNNRESFTENNNLSNKNIILKEFDTSTCILEIRSFSGNESEFKVKVEEQFKKIQEKGYEYLIIDVRNNGGGNDRNGRTVVDFITDKPYSEALASTFMMKRSKRYEKYQKCDAPWIVRWIVNLRTASWFNKENRKLYKGLLNTPTGDNLIAHLPLNEPTNNPYRFKGNVYALSNQYSYSATTVFLGAVKDYKIGTIVGTETGDCPTGFGQNLYFELQNSRLRCHSSTTFMIRPNGNKDMTHGVIPDYHIEQTNKDSEYNRDSILSFTLDLIKKTKHNMRYN